jgi:hypothetical protein
MSWRLTYYICAMKASIPLFGWAYQHDLSAVEQYFSLTANQPQPAYKPKKQPAEQGLYKGARYICERTNKEMAPLIYPCLLCILVYCSWGLESKTRSIYDFYTYPFWIRNEKWIWQSMNRPILNRINIWSISRPIDAMTWTGVGSWRLLDDNSIV